MYLALIILPLLGSIVSGFFGRKVGVSGAQLITCSCVIATTFMATISFLEVGLNNVVVSFSLFRWIDVESLNVIWAFNYDSLTVSMLIPVLMISSLVHVYSVGYMSHDPHNQRFFSYLGLFTFMMIVLLTAKNFLLMFVGWEGVGVCSYLLVSFWFTRIAANQSSLSAFLTNRVGDCFFTLGMFAMIWTFGDLDYSTVFSLAPYVNHNVVTIIGICLLIGAMAKSSQIGLHVWLPLAMEGPTPVSALIHAATMVTAGVYLLMRISPLIEYSSTVLIVCLCIGSITTVFSSLIGLFQQDIKKVIAYSTMSQLGMMVIAVGLSSYNVALFHLINHAFYKGLLFLGAGAVIHAVADNQDFRRYGGLITFLPLTYSVMLIASLSLIAFPFMSGFYSKDFILESAYGQFHFSSLAVYYMATIGAVFTTLYSVKVLHVTFLTNANGPLINYKKAHEGDIFMSLPLVILAIFSTFFGYMSKDMFIGLASAFFMDNSLFIHPLHEIMLETEFAVSTFFKLLPLLLTVSFIVFSLVLSEFLPKALLYFKFTRLGYNIFSFFNQRLLIELLYNKYLSRFIFKVGEQTTRVLDKGSIEMLGPYGLEIKLLALSTSLGKLHTAVTTSYALYILVGLISYMLIPSISCADISLLLFTTFALSTVLNSNNTHVAIALTSLNANKNKIKENIMTSVIYFKTSMFIWGYIVAYSPFTMYAVHIISFFIAQWLNMQELNTMGPCNEGYDPVLSAKTDLGPDIITSYNYGPEDSTESSHVPSNAGSNSNNTGSSNTENNSGSGHTGHSNVPANTGHSNVPTDSERFYASGQPKYPYIPINTWYDDGPGKVGVNFSSRNRGYSFGQPNVPANIGSSTHNYVPDNTGHNYVPDNTGSNVPDNTGHSNDPANTVPYSNNYAPSNIAPSDVSAETTRLNRVQNELLEDMRGQKTKYDGERQAFREENKYIGSCKDIGKPSARTLAHANINEEKKNFFQDWIKDPASGKQCAAFRDSIANGKPRWSAVLISERLIQDLTKYRK